MSDPIIPTPQVLVQQLNDDAILAAKAIALIRAKDIVGLAKLASENETKIIEQVKEAEALIPLVKQGWKTTEFWLIAIYGGINVWFAAKGITLPLGDDVSVGTLIAGYAASRHAIKQSANK